MKFIDGDGNIIVPKSVRPIIDYKKTLLGNKKNAKNQYRYGNLHVREYENHYTVHIDKIDPRKNPIGHLLIDAPEYITSFIIASYIGTNAGKTIYKKKKSEGNLEHKSIADALIIGVLSGLASYTAVQNIYNKTKNFK
ncbi:MAG: hypothetical protein ACPKQO_09030 [Nitrososphaeraceae archaeon]